jgi:hypothetical protein
MSQKTNLLITLMTRLRLFFTVVGAALAFAGERYFAASVAHWWLCGIGWGFMFLGVVAGVMAVRKAQNEDHAREVPIWNLAICWQSQILGSFLLFAVYQRVLGARPFPDDFASKALLVAWLLLAVFGTFMGIGMEWAQSSNGSGIFSESGRVRRATQGWLKIGMLAVIIASTQFVAIKRNISWDLSYLKTARPSPATLKILDSLAQDVEIVMFFPLGSEVLSQAKLYMSTLTGRPHLTVSTQDVEMNPVAAETFKVSRNGVIVLRSAGQTERVDLGLTLSSARKGLKNIDVEFQKALLALTEKKKTIYFTRGHGELTWTSGDEGSALKSIKMLEAYLRSVNFNLRFFGMTEGSTKQVPVDADAVVIVGGQQPFLPEEASAIERYVDGGGRVFALLDVDTPTEASVNQGVRDASKDPLTKWLSGLGIEFQAKVLANENNFVAATRSAADSWFLFTNIFTSHESVQNLARNDQRTAILTFRSGFLNTRRDLQGWSVQDTVRSLSDTFIDENRDFKLSPGEKKDPRVLGAIAEQKRDPKAPGDRQARVIVFADATTASDALLRNQANLIYFVDGLRWLVGDVKASGIANTEEDVKIRHTNKEDIAWFYGTVALVPGLVLLAGGLVRRRFKGRVA